MSDRNSCLCSRIDSTLFICFLNCLFSINEVRQACQGYTVPLYFTCALVTSTGEIVCMENVETDQPVFVKISYLRYLLMSRLEQTIKANVAVIVDAINPTPMRFRHRGPSNVLPDSNRHSDFQNNTQSFDKCIVEY